jgi:Na+/melibiose symporter-like transporter
VLFGLAEMPLQIATLAILAYIPNYYGMDLGVSLASVATVLMIARLFDAVTDPLVGYFSDRTQSRWGRRRVWMVASIPVLILAVYRLTFPDPLVDAGYLLLWMVVFWLGWTMLQIPYYAWAAELSDDYNERSVIVGWRSAVGLVANILSKLIPVIAVYFFAVSGTKGVLQIIGIILLCVTPVAVGVTVAFVPERMDFKEVTLPVMRGLRLLWRNGPFKRLMLSFFLTNIGAAFGTTLVLFYIRAVLGEESAGIVVLLVYYAASLTGVSFWVWLSRRLGKHRAVFFAYLSFWAGMIYMFLGKGDFYYMLPVMVVTGFCGSALWTLPNAMKADVIDVDRLRCGQNRAAWFFSVWSFGIKLAQSVGPMLALLMLDATGFDAAPKTTNTEDDLFGLRVLYSFGTPVFYTLAALVIWNYPLTQKRHLKIRASIERRVAKDETQPVGA